MGQRIRRQKDRGKVVGVAIKRGNNGGRKIAVKRKKKKKKK